MRCAPAPPVPFRREQRPFREGSSAGVQKWEALPTAMPSLVRSNIHTARLRTKARLIGDTRFYQAAYCRPERSRTSIRKWTPPKEHSRGRTHRRYADNLFIAVCGPASPEIWRRVYQCPSQGWLLADLAIRRASDATPLFVPCVGVRVVLRARVDERGLRPDGARPLLQRRPEKAALGESETCRQFLRADTSASLRKTPL